MQTAEDVARAVDEEVLTDELHDGVGWDADLVVWQCVLVDDHLAYASLGVLRLPDDVDQPMLAVDAFRVPDRRRGRRGPRTRGALQRLVAASLDPGRDPLSHADRATSAVRVAGPTSHAAGVADAVRELVPDGALLWVSEVQR